MDRFGKVLLLFLPLEKEFRNVFARASACLNDSSLWDSTNLKIFFIKKFQFQFKSVYQSKVLYLDQIKTQCQ